jgi:F-type H+-transporting ATPase subunit gamma
MPSRQQIKGRIRSVRNTRQITKAMEMVSAARMRRAQDHARRTRRYSVAARELLTSLRAQIDIDAYQLFAAHPVKTRLLITISSDRGLAGAYDGNVLRQLTRELQQDKAAGIITQCITIGRQAANFTARLSGVKVIDAYRDFPDQPTAENIQPIVHTALRRFTSKRLDAVDVIYTHSNSSVSQEVRVLRLLPAGFTDTPLNKTVSRARFEPSAKLVLRTAARRLVEMQMMQALLEAVASEHSMRMLAMKNATDNATDLIADYTLAYNNARQSAITQELAEITGGAEALTN